MNNLINKLNKKYTILIAGIIVVVFFGIILLSLSSPSPTPPGTPGNTTGSGESNSSGSNQSSTAPGNKLSTPPNPTQAANPSDQYPIPAYQNNYIINFKSSAYAKYAYQVFPGPISQKTKDALGPFNISTLKYPDNSTVVTLHFNMPGYQDVQVTAQQGESVYFIKLPNYEDPGDAGLVRVNADGNIAAN